MGLKSANNFHSHLFWLLISFSVFIATLNIFVEFESSRRVIIRDFSQEQIHYWEAVAQKYPTYLDTYLVLHDLYKETGNNKMALKALTNAYRIDPLNTKVWEKAKVLGIRSF